MCYISIEHFLTQYNSDYGKKQINSLVPVPL